MYMKKKITSKKELNSMALASGAMVTDASGKKFNSKKKVAAKKPPKPKLDPTPKRLEKAEPPPKPAYTPPPKPAGPDEGSKLVADSVNQSSKAMVMMISELKKQISEIQFNATQPILEWDFIPERDAKTGYLTRLKAVAVIANQTLN